MSQTTTKINRAITQGLNPNVYEYLKSTRFLSKLKEMEASIIHLSESDQDLVYCWFQAAYLQGIADAGVKIADILLADQND